MKHLLKLAGLSLAVLVASPSSAVDLTPIPAGPGTILPAPQAYPAPAAPGFAQAAPHGTIVPGSVYVDAAPEPLFDCVKYVDKHEMHPCAITKIIRVNNPCLSKHKHKDSCATCCEPPCVYVQICVPPCGCEEVKCKKHGDRVRYDYGKYAVDVRVKKGFIVVDYQN